MKIYTDFSNNNFDDPITKFELNKFSKRKSDLSVYCGIKSQESQIKNNKFNIYLDFEEPNWFWWGLKRIHKILNIYPINYPRNFENKFDKIFTICPYTADYINKKSNNKKREFIFFPFNKKFIFKKKKRIDVIYSGTLYGPILDKISEIISNYNYRIISFSNNKFVTDKNISYKKKINLIAESKISIIHNLLFLNEIQIKHVKKYSDYKKNMAFKFINKKIVPQQKSRMFEAAFSRSLMLVKKDPWNLIEYFFNPNQDFIYFNKEEDLPKLINKILKNYNLYKPMVNNAFKKAKKNYTVCNFYKKHLFKYETNINRNHNHK